MLQQGSTRTGVLAAWCFRREELSLAIVGLEGNLRTPRGLSAPWAAGTWLPALTLQLPQSPRRRHPQRLVLQGGAGWVQRGAPKPPQFYPPI